MTAKRPTQECAGLFLHILVEKDKRKSENEAQDKAYGSASAARRSTYFQQKAQSPCISRCRRRKRKNGGSTGCRAWGVADAQNNVPELTFDTACNTADKLL